MCLINNRYAKQLLSLMLLRPILCIYHRCKSASSNFAVHNEV